MVERSDQSPRSLTEAEWRERRSSVRLPCLETSRRLVAAIGPTFYLAKIRNISPEGISLVIPRPMEQGTLLSVDLIETKTNRSSRTLDVRICWCIEHPSGDWIIGGAFASPLTDEELQYFLKTE